VLAIVPDGSKNDSQKKKWGSEQFGSVENAIMRFMMLFLKKRILVDIGILKNFLSPTPI
jgi:hypothetical protein